ncbi:MAG: permease-like cell division protein FtsX, partial [Leucobacter sp.]
MRAGLVLGEVWNGLRRNMSVVISVVLVTFVSLTFVGAAILMQLQIQQMKTFWYDRAQVAVYLCVDSDQTATCSGEDAGEDVIKAVEDALQSDTLAPYVQDYFFVDHEQGYKEFTQQFAGNPIVDITKPEQIPQTFWVKLDDPSRADIIKEAFTGIPGVQSVMDQRSLLDKIFVYLGAASYTAIAIAGLMLVAAMLLISTTIRLSAFSRRREIGIMRLVGASNRFIQTPFILEGIIAALVGAVLAGAASVAIVRFFVQGFLASEAPFTSYITVEQSLIVPPILLVNGASLARKPCTKKRTIAT